MDIFERAKECNADYMDPHTGHIYKIMAFNAGQSPRGIEVVDTCGYRIGYIPALTEQKEPVAATLTQFGYKGDI